MLVVGVGQGIALARPGASVTFGMEQRKACRMMGAGEVQVELEGQAGG